LTSISTRRRTNASLSPAGRSWTPDPAAPLAAGDLAVHGAGRHGHRLALLEDVLAALDHEPHRALDHLVALRLGGVHVRLDQEAAGAADHVELEQLAVRVLGGPADLEPDAQPRVLKRGHVRTLTRSGGFAPACDTDLPEADPPARRLRVLPVALLARQAGAHRHERADDEHEHDERAEYGPPEDDQAASTAAAARCANREREERRTAGGHARGTPARSAATAGGPVFDAPQAG
jgi:hypothetical protein